MSTSSLQNHLKSRKKSQCVCCSKPFAPNPRLGLRQKTCGLTVCKKNQKASYRRGYRELNSAPEKEYQEKSKALRSPDYWRKYREAHPEYVKRNRLRSRLCQRLSRAGLQRQLDILELVEFPDEMARVEAFAMSTRSLYEEFLDKKCG